MRTFPGYGKGKHICVVLGFDPNDTAAKDVLARRGLSDVYGTGPLPKVCPVEIGPGMTAQALGAKLDALICGPEKTAELIDAEVKRLVDEITARAETILTENWAGLENLAGQLIEKEIIMSEDIEAVLGPKAGKHGEERLAKNEPEAATEDTFTTNTTVDA